MPFRCIDIRVVNTPKEEVVDAARKFIVSNHFALEREQTDGKTTVIRALNPIDSCLRFWWNSNPQIVEWTITNLKEDITRIETRFRLQQNFRVWFWVILGTLFSLSVILYGDSLRLNVLSLACLAGSAVIMSSLWSTDKYKYVVDSLLFKLTKSGAYSPNHSKTIQSNIAVPDMWALVIMVILGVVVLMGKIWLFHDWVGIRIVTAFVLFIIIAASSWVYFGIKHIGFFERLPFFLVGAVAVLPLLVAFNIPNIYFLTIDKNLHPVLNMIFFAIFFGSAILFLLILIQLARSVHDYYTKFLKEIALGSVYHEAANFSHFSREFSSVVIIYWIITSFFLLLGLYGTMSTVEMSIIGKNYIFIGRVGENFYTELVNTIEFVLPFEFLDEVRLIVVRIFVLIYAFPVLFIILKIINKRKRKYIGELRALRKGLVLEQHGKLSVFEQVTPIAQYAGMKPPQIVLLDSDIPNTEARYLGFPYFRSYLMITKGLIERLEITEIEGLLAHEICHIKHHTSKWYLLNLLSDYTFFGTGFLTVATNSYLKELQADDFAVAWLKKRKIRLSNFIRALRIMALSRSGTELERTSLRLGADQGAVNKMTSKAKTSFSGKIKRNFEILFEMYFGDKILSYIHPPLAVRIARIEVSAISD